MSKLKKYVEECRDQKNTELEIIDKGVTNILEIPGLLELGHLTRLTLSHNKIPSHAGSVARFQRLLLYSENRCLQPPAVPPTITNLYSLETLNLFNNHIKELPTTLSSMTKLRILNVGMNKMSSLPRGFGACPVLEVLDLTYNNLNENGLPANFFQLDSLRALYIGDNDFEILPPEIGKLKNLMILVLRDNDLIALPREIGDLPRLRELHVQGNRLTVLPPELGNLDLVGSKQAFRGENNPWVAPIADQFQIGVSHVFEYIRTDTYKFLYGRHLAADAAPPPKTNDKSKKISRMG